MFNFIMWRPTPEKGSFEESLEKLLTGIMTMQYFEDQILKPKFQEKLRKSKRESNNNTEVAISNSNIYQTIRDEIKGEILAYGQKTGDLSDLEIKKLRAVVCSSATLGGAGLCGASLAAEEGTLLAARLFGSRFLSFPVLGAVVSAIGLLTYNATENERSVRKQRLYDVINVVIKFFDEKVSDYVRTLNENVNGGVIQFENFMQENAEMKKEQAEVKKENAEVKKENAEMKKEQAEMKERMERLERLLSQNNGRSNSFTEMVDKSRGNGNVREL